MQAALNICLVIPHSDVPFPMTQRDPRKSPRDAMSNMVILRTGVNPEGDAPLRDSRAKHARARTPLPLPYHQGLGASCLATFTLRSSIMPDRGHVAQCLALERHRTDTIRSAGLSCRVNRPGATYVRAVKNGISVAVLCVSCHGNGFKRARHRGQKPFIHTLHPASMSMPTMALERAEKVAA
ncbi:hypothetical protein [Tateyamaria sp.]|uniref:hypothetical protein n=1 Tax=Tateyamaria sp. TaxID=1929288 RepID=UPI00329BB34E